MADHSSSPPPPLCVLLFFLLASLVSASTAYAGGLGRKVGARSDVKDVDTNAVQDLGRFAVAEHNRRIEEHGSGGEERGRLLAFSQVVSAQKQVVSGIMYYLRIAAVREDEGLEGQRQMFDAAVVVKPWLGVRKLVSFTPFTHLLAER